MKEPNENDELILFGRIKDVQMYLLRFGKKMHKATINEQIAFKEKMKKRHDSKKIKMLVNRLEDELDNHKASSHFTSAFFVILSFTFGSTLNYGLSFVVDVGELATTIILMVFYTAFFIWGWLSWFHSNKLKKASRYKTLLQECIDEMSEKESKRRFLKFTNKYRTP
ncbi:MAG: hypothetical protein ACQEWR_12745 [Bacillota bacterium]